MYAEKLRQQGELAAWHVAGVAAVMPFVNAKLDPRAINPYRRRSPADGKVEEVKAFIAAMAWKVMVAEAMKHAGRE